MGNLFPCVPSFHTWPSSFHAALCVTWDVDDEAPYYSRGLTSHHDVSEIEQRQYGIRRAVPAIFSMLQEAGIPASFYVPAYIAKQWPQVVQTLTTYGYEIGAHGFLHEPVRNLGIEDEARIIKEAVDVLGSISHQSILGYRTPSWQFNEWTADLLCRNGVLYDSSLMGDHSVYQLAIETGQTLFEIPIHWNLDDVEFWGHTHVTRSHTISAPSAVYEIWTAELDGIVQRGGVCVLTLHPHVSGRPGLLSVVHRFIRYAKSLSALWITTPREIAQYVSQNALTVPTVRLASAIPNERYIP